MTMTAFPSIIPTTGISVGAWTEPEERRSSQVMNMASCDFSTGVDFHYLGEKDLPRRPKLYPKLRKSNPIDEV